MNRGVIISDDAIAFTPRADSVGNADCTYVVDEEIGTRATALVTLDALYGVDLPIAVSDDGHPADESGEILIDPANPNANDLGLRQLSCGLWHQLQSSVRRPGHHVY